MIDDHKIHAYQKRYVGLDRDKTLFHLRKSNTIGKKDQKR